MEFDVGEILKRGINAVDTSAEFSTLPKPSWPKRNRQITLWIALAILLIWQKQDVPAGIFLAISTSKPQMSYLLIILVILWAVSRGRTGLVVSTIFSWIAIMVVSLLLLNDWPIQLLRQLVADDFVIRPSPLSVIASSLPGIEATLNGVLHIVAILYLLIEWYLVWRKDERWFLWTGT